MSGREAETGRWVVVETKVRRARRRRKKDLDWCWKRKGGMIELGWDDRERDGREESKGKRSYILRDVFASWIGEEILQLFGDL